MSQVIDERVVSIKFDNRRFQQGVEETLKDVEKLNKGLKFDGASEGLEKVNKEIEKIDTDEMNKSITIITQNFERMGAVGFTVLQRLTNSVIDFGKKTVDMFAIRPVTTGFDEYGLKMGAVSTIMGATGASIEEINGYLDELNEYSDKTIYSFADMTQNIGKFTNAGVKLKDAVAAIKGISSEAALAGANANEASRAMYNFAQALATGSVKLIDWKSIENANMATVGFKEELLKTAEEIGTVVKDASGMYQVLTTNASGSSMKEAISATRNFNDSLSYQWMTSEVLVETLKKYSDETTEIGAKAMEAATEVKTFGAMMNTLQESAQSGWAATWESIIGDYEQSKAIWTQFTKFFDGILSASSEARNALIGNAMKLQNAEGLSGREAIWQSLLNILEAVRDVLGAVKKAWEDVFPPITDQRLRGIIESIYQFSKGLKQSDEQLEKIRQTFRGIFAILDMFITLVRFAFRIAVKAVTGLAQVITTVLFAGFAGILLWIEKIKTAETGFNAVIRNIAKGVQSFVGYIKSLGGLSLSNVLKAIFAFSASALERLFDPDSVLSLLIDFAHDIGVVFIGMFKGAEYAEERVRTIAGRFLVRFIMVKEELGRIFNDIWRVIQNWKITPQQVMTAGVIVAVGLIILTLRNFVKSLTGIFDSISGVFESISGVIKKFGTKLKADSMNAVASALTKLVASIAILTILASKKEQLYIALAVLGIIAAEMVGIMFAMGKMGTGHSIAFAATILAFGLAVYQLTKTLGLIQEVAKGGIAQPIAILTLLIVELTAVAKLIGSTKKQYTIGVLSMLSFVLALRMMVDVLKKLDETELLNVNRSLKFLLAMSASLALVGLGFQNVKFGAFASMISAALSMKMLVGVIESFENLDPATISKTLNTILIIFAGFAGLMVASRIGNVKKLGGAILSIAASLLIITQVIKLMNSFSDAELDRATEIISKISLVFSVLVAASFLSGRYADKAGKMLIRMSWALMLLSGVMLVLSKFSQVGELDYPLRVITQLMIIMGLIVAATALIPGTENVVKVFGAMKSAVIILVALVAAMSFLPNQEELQNVTFCISLLIGAFAVLVASTGLAKKATGTILLLTGVVFALSGILAAMSYLRLDAFIETAASIGVLMVALAGSMAILGKAESVNTKAVGQMMLLAVVVGELALIFTLLKKIGPVEVGIKAAVSIGVLINALASSMLILGKADTIDTKTVGKVMLLSLIIDVFAAVLGGINYMASANGGPGLEIPITSAIALGILINALSSAFLILSLAQSGITNQTVGQVALLATILGLLYGVIALIQKFVGPVEMSIETAGSLSILLLSLSAVCAVCVLVGSFAVEALAGIGVLTGFILIMSGLMGLLGATIRENPNAEKDLNSAIMIFNKIGEAIGALFGGIANGALQSIDLNFFTRLGEDFQNFVDVLTPVLETFATLDTSAFENMKSLAATFLMFTAADFIDGLSLFGQIFGNKSLNDFATQIGTLGTGLKDFTTNVEGIQVGADVNNAIDLLGKLIEAADDIPESGGLAGLIMGNNDIDDFAAQFETLAFGLMSFCDGVQGIQYNTYVDQAIECMKKLAQASQEIPNTGGLLADLIGDNRMDDFAKQLPTVADGVVKFCDGIQGLKYNETTVTNACDTIKKLAYASKAIPNIGGWLADFVGDNRLDDFAEQMPKAAEGVKGFCEIIDGIDDTYVDKAISVLTKVADFEKSLDEKGGLIGGVFGETDMQLFGTQLSWLGYGLWIYSAWVDKIKDYDLLEKSISTIENFATLAQSISGINTDRFDMFKSEMVQFAKDSLVEFVNIFKNADVKSTGTDLGESLAEGAKGTRTKFVSAANWLIEGFISGVKIKMSSYGGIKDVGRDLGKQFLDGMTDGLEVESPSKKTQWIGEMTVLGFEKGITGNNLDIFKVGGLLGDYFMEGAQDRLGIHSPSEEGSWLGSMITEGLKEGMMTSAKSLLGSFDGLWGKMQNLASDGINKIKGLLGENSLWDFSAGIGDNLVAAKDKLKEWLGFGDSGGLSDLFGFGSLGDALEDEILDSYSGIQEGMEGLADEIAGSGGSTSDLAEALKLSLHKHFDSKEFIYLGEQIGENMAIAANNAIVSNSKAMGDTLAEVITITAGGLESWKAWLEVRKAYDQVSQKDQLAGWTMIQKMYTEGSKERMEADREVYNLQKELVKGTFDYSKKWIDNEKYYERLSLEEELAAWERIQARYLEGSDERIEAEKEVYRIKKEIRKKDYEDAKKWIEQEKKYERLSLADELAAYLRIRKTTEEGSDERLEMDEKVYDLQKSIYEAEQQYIKDVEEAQQEAAEERLRLEEEYADRRREIEEQLADDIASLNEQYQNEVEQRRKSLYSSYGLFDAVEEKEFDKDELMQNLEDQVRAFEEWQMTLNQLASRGLDKALIDELTEMGPSAKGQIEALNSMTDAELGQYNLLWSEKSSMAREQAIGELEDLRVQTAENISKLQQLASEELDYYRQIWADSMSQVTENCNAKLEELRKDFGETVGTIKKDTDTKMREMAESATRILKEAGWDEAGEQIVEGIEAGIENKKGSLLQKVVGLATSVIQGFKEKLQIQSPSKVMKEAGEYTAEGIIQGLMSYYDKAWESGNVLAEELQNGAFEAIKYINELVEEGMDETFTLRPVIDLTNVKTGISDMNSMFDVSKAVNLAASANLSLDQSRDLNFINPNEKVVQELQSLRKDLGKLGEQVASMQLVMDTGAVVGQITGPLDTALGTRIVRNTRERG